MKKVIFCFLLVIISKPVISQTTLRSFKRGVKLEHSDSIKTNMVVSHIVKELNNQAHSIKTGAIYDITSLEGTECYRELINRKTSTPFYIKVDCESEHARTGFYFWKKSVLD
jgi:hypothetical protein